MKLKTACCLLFLAISFHIAAQQTKSDQSFERKWMIRLNPLGLADPFETNFSMGAEYIFRDRWAVAADASWVIESRYFSNAKSSGGMIFRPAVRYYFNEKRTAFLELEGQYKEVGYTIHDWLGKNDVNGVSAYEELTDFRFQKNVWGLHIKGGLKAPISRSKKFWIEGYWGVGFRVRRTFIRNEPNSSYNASGDNFFNGANDATLPAVPVGLRLLYLL